MGQKHHASGTLRRKGEGSPGGTLRKSNAVGAESWAGSAPKVRRER
jgi:hypothetical protein